MYAPHAFAQPARGGARMYSHIGVETGVSDASPHRLVAMLFDGFFESVAHAQAAIAAGQIEAKGKAIGRAACIVEEGLKAALDLQAGGSLAADLAQLYAYIAARLTHANLKSDSAALDECKALMQPLREAWTSIAPQAAARGSAR